MEIDDVKQQPNSTISNISINYHCKQQPQPVYPKCITNLNMGLNMLIINLQLNIIIVTKYVRKGNLHE